MPLADRGGRLLCGTLLVTSCHTVEPGRRDFAYNLGISALVRDFPGQRYYDCRVTFELDVYVPLPDSFTTVADAHVTRSVVQDSGQTLTADTGVRGVTVRVERLPRAEPSPFSPDSLQVVLAGAIADTIHGIGAGGDEGRYDGGWTCGTAVPPHGSTEPQEHGYPAGQLDPGEWHLFAIYPGV